jgi:hypothetical protein
VTQSDSRVHIYRHLLPFRYLIDYLEYVSNMVKPYHLHDCCEGTLLPEPPRMASTDVYGLCRFCRDSSRFVSCLPADPQVVDAIKAEFDFWGVPFPQSPLGSTALAPVLSMPPAAPAGHVRPPSRRKSTVCALRCCLPTHCLRRSATHGR